MRNLKRALSLTLASVMLLGMMVVGSSAAAGYDDVADTDNVEAIEVLQAVEVMVGDERGFGPERPVNRAEMAVVMGKLLNLDYNYYEATCPFNDVYDWARGWVGACYANGIVSGRGEGVYDPGTTVTAVEAASMLMRALGYFKYQSDYASGFEVSTVLQANKIRLFDGVNSKTNEPLTRNQVAQMALNALKSGMVEPDGNALNFIDANGNVIATGGKVNYVFVTSNKTFATAISSVKASSMGSSNDSPIVELGEQLYDGKLKLTDTTDDFERPSRYWEYDAKAIGTYVKEELIRQEYTVKVTGRTLHDLLGSTTIKDYDLVVAIDGVDDSDVNTHVFNKSAMVRTNENGVGATGKGVLTQVFVDPDEGANGLITIAIINTYLAIAEEDFDDRTDDVDFRVYGIEPIPNYRNEYWKTANISNSKPTDESSIFKLETEDFPEIVDVKENDATLVTVAKGEVQTMAAPEILSGVQISSFKQADWIVSGGTQYDFASAAEFEMDTLYDYTATDNAVVNLKDINYNIYLDKYGYAVGVEEVDRVDNYMFITGVDTNTVNRYAVQADASAIFLDGTMEAVKIDMKAARDLVDQSTYQALVGTDAEITENIKGGSLINKWFTYTVGNDGVYEVVLVGDDAAVDKGARAGQFRTLTEKDASIPDGTGFAALGTASHGVDKIGPKSIALRGADTPNSTWYSVYGDDQSVYITAELETIQDANGSDKYHVNIISGVDNVAVGIDEADIEVWDKNTALAKGTTSMNPVATAYGSYVLFDDDGDIIGAVVVGEDAGTVTNLVYTHKSKIESETDNNAGSSRANSTKGDYTWTRKVVSNGEEVTLTEVGSGLSKLKSMLPNTWYVVKYNAKGEVKNVYPAWDTAKYAYGYKGLIDAQPTDPALEEKTRTEDQYVNNIEELNTATNENSMVLFEVGQYNTGKTTPVSSIVRNDYDAKAVGDVNWLGGDSTPTDVRMSGKPYVDNHTLYITTQTNTGVHRGFRVADDVKTVFIQTNNREETTVFESGYSRLEKVIDRLHDHAEYGNWAGVYAYHYEISAVMNNGKATVVVIRDLNNAGANFTYDRNRELRLYGNLFTSPTTVTGASNAVVTVGNEEVKPTGIGTDRYGSYTAYSIPQGSIVGIVDYDIDNVDPRFDYMTNMVYSDLNVRYLNRTITFTMPAYDAWIDGGRLGTFVDTIYGTLDSVVTGVTATFDGHASGVKYDKVYNTGMTVVISGLKADTKYEVSIGDPAVVDNYLSDADGKITFSYLVTGADMRTGSVAIHSVKPTDGTVDPKPPIDPDKKDAEVTVTSGLVNIKKDGKVISKITADFKMDTKDMGVKTGDVLTIEPADALKVTGADKNADGTFTVKETTVTISPADGYTWHPLFRQYIDKDGHPTLVEWVSALAVNSVNPVAKRFSLTRAAADDLVDEDKGESKIDTSKLNWFYDLYTSGVRNFEFRARLADGTVFVENVAIEGTKITVTYDQTKFTPAQYAEYLGVLGANVNDVVTVNPGTDTPTPADRVIVEPANATKTAFNVYRYKAEPKNADIPALVLAEIQKTDTTATKAEWKKGDPVGNAGKITVTYTKADGTETKADRDVTIVDVAKVIYGTTELGYVAKTGNTKSLGSFGEKSILLGGAKDVKTGVQLAVTKVGETYQVVPNPGTAVDDYYIYDALKVSAADASVVIDAWADGTKEGGAVGAVVAPGIDLYLTLDVGVGDEGKDLELRSGDKVIKTVTFKNSGTVKYALENVSKDWADKNGEIKLSLSSQKYTVKLGSETVTGAVGDKVTLKTAEAGVQYIVKLTDTDANALTTGYTSGLEYTIKSADAVKGVITIYPAYVFDWGSGTDPVSAGTVTVGSAKAKTDASAVVGADDQLVAVGAKVWITGKATSNQEVNIGDTALKVEHKSTSSSDPWKYSFIMPEENVVAKAFVPTSFGTPTLADGTTLNTAGTTVTYTVTAATVGGVSVTGDVTVNWYSDVNKTSTASAPDNLVVKTATASSLVFTTEEKAKVAVGEYYFTLSIGNVESAAQTLTVTAPVAASGTDLETLLEEEDNVVLNAGAGADPTINGLTIGNGKTVTASKGDNDLTLTNVTVAKGGKLEITNAVKLGGDLTVNGTLELTGADAGDKLNVNGNEIILNEGATLILSEIYDDLSDLSIADNSNGTVVINKTTTDGALTTLANLCATAETTKNEGGGYTVTKSDALKIQTETPNVYLKDFSALKMQVGKTYSMYDLSGVVAAVDNDKVKAVATYADGSTKVIIAGPDKLDEYTVTAGEDCEGGELKIQGLFETTIEKIVVTLTADADGSVTTYTFNFK